MWCSIVTLFPEIFSGFFNCGMVHQAIKQKKLNCSFINPREFSVNDYGAVDDRPYGGGPGMVMQVPPLRQAIHAAKEQSPAPAKVIFVSPQGNALNTKMARNLAKEQALIFVAGRYEGIDQRVIDNDIDDVISIGDYVLTGGEVPIMVILEALIRWIPGVLGDESSNIEDSFTEEMGGLLDCPHYTRPAHIDEQSVPEVLLSGDHQAIKKWRQKQRLGLTWQNRPDILAKANLTQEDRRLLAEFKHEFEIEFGSEENERCD